MWDRDEETRLGDHYKKLEAWELEGVGDTFEPYDTFVIRVDGRAFHTFARGMTKPFSTVMDDCRNAAAEAVLRSLKPDFAYHQSDEISFVWKAVSAPTTEHPFGGRKTKLLTLTAALTSSAFLKKYIELTGDFSKTPHFDARVAACFNNRNHLEDAIKCVQWRENDAMRNSMQMLGQSMFSHKQLNKKSVGDIYDMCKAAGTDWYDTAPEFRRGTYVTIGTEDRVIDEEQRLRIPEAHRPEVGAVVTRGVIKRQFFDDWDIEKRIATLFEPAND